MCTYWKKLKRSSTKKNKTIDSIGIGLASPEEIRRWGERKLPNGAVVGKVDKDHTVDYESLKPIEGGLFCERIFGPVEDFYCSCERRGEKGEQFCSECEVEFTKSRVRRTRMGYIPLAVPVAHVWYLRGRPSYIANLIGKSRSTIDKVAYGETLCESFIGNTLQSTTLTRAENCFLHSDNGISSFPSPLSTPLTGTETNIRRTSLQSMSTDSSKNVEPFVSVDDIHNTMTPYAEPEGSSKKKKPTLRGIGRTRSFQSSGGSAELIPSTTFAEKELLDQVASSKRKELFLSQGILKEKRVAQPVPISSFQALDAIIASEKTDSKKQQLPQESWNRYESAYGHPFVGAISATREGSKKVDPSGYSKEVDIPLPLPAVPFGARELQEGVPSTLFSPLLRRRLTLAELECGVGFPGGFAPKSLSILPPGNPYPEGNRRKGYRRTEFTSKLTEKQKDVTKENAMSWSAPRGYTPRQLTKRRMSPLLSTRKTHRKEEDKNNLTFPVDFKNSGLHLLGYSCTAANYQPHFHISNAYFPVKQKGTAEKSREFAINVNSADKSALRKTTTVAISKTDCIDREINCKPVRGADRISYTKFSIDPNRNPVEGRTSSTDYPLEKKRVSLDFLGITERRYHQLHTLPVFSTFTYKEWSDRFAFLDYLIWPAKRYDLPVPFYTRVGTPHIARRCSVNLVKNQFGLEKRPKLLYDATNVLEPPSGFAYGISETRGSTSYDVNGYRSVVNSRVNSVDGVHINRITNKPETNKVLHGLSREFTDAPKSIDAIDFGAKGAKPANTSVFFPLSLMRNIKLTSCVLNELVTVVPSVSPDVDSGSKPKDVSTNHPSGEPLPRRGTLLVSTKLTTPNFVQDVEVRSQTKIAKMDTDNSCTQLPLSTEFQQTSITPLAKIDKLMGFLHKSKTQNCYQETNSSKLFGVGLKTIKEEIHSFTSVNANYCETASTLSTTKSGTKSTNSVPPLETSFPNRIGAGGTDLIDGISCPTPNCVQGHGAEPTEDCKPLLPRRLTLADWKRVDNKDSENSTTRGADKIERKLITPLVVSVPMLSTSFITKKVAKELCKLTDVKVRPNTKEFLHQQVSTNLKPQEVTPDGITDSQEKKTLQFIGKTPIERYKPKIAVASVSSFGKKEDIRIGMPMYKKSIPIQQGSIALMYDKSLKKWLAKHPFRNLDCQGDLTAALLINKNPTVSAKVAVGANEYVEEFSGEPFGALQDTALGSKNSNINSVPGRVNRDLFGYPPGLRTIPFVGAISATREGSKKVDPSGYSKEVDIPFAEHGFGDGSQPGGFAPESIGPRAEQLSQVNPSVDATNGAEDSADGVGKANEKSLATPLLSSFHLRSQSSQRASNKIDSGAEPEQLLHNDSNKKRTETSLTSSTRKFVTEVDCSQYLALGGKYPLAFIIDDYSKRDGSPLINITSSTDPMDLKDRTFLEPSYSDPWELKRYSNLIVKEFINKEDQIPYTGENRIGAPVTMDSRGNECAISVNESSLTDQGYAVRGTGGLQEKKVGYPPGYGKEKEAQQSNKVDAKKPSAASDIQNNQATMWRKVDAVSTPLTDLSGYPFVNEVDKAAKSIEMSTQSSAAPTPRGFLNFVQGGLTDTQQFPRLSELLHFTGGTALRHLLSRFHFVLLGRFLRHELKTLELKINHLLALKMLTYSQGLLLGKLAKRRSKQIRRLKLIELFQSQKSNPEWMILSVLPVLPPDLRPILRVNDDFVVASDLNRLYQTVVRRNNTIKERLDDPLPCPESGLFRQRSLQKAVDGLLENGKGGGTPLCAAKRRPLVSLSHILKGKKGLFRQHLLGKRVDYSGRSVIVVGPKLNLHECGLPKEMAMELFQPFLIHRLKIQGLATSNTAARQMIQQEDPAIWHTVKQLIYEHPVLLNRAPTLHRLGIQAFQPRLVSGRAILLHPLVCNGFNADFDGDQMAVHVPLSFQARAEAWKIMWSKNNLLSPATGQPILVPSQDMVLGCYYLSVIVPPVKREFAGAPQGPRECAEATRTLQGKENSTISPVDNSLAKNVKETSLKFSQSPGPDKENGEREHSPDTFLQSTPLQSSGGSADLPYPEPFGVGSASPFLLFSEASQDVGVERLASHSYPHPFLRFSPGQGNRRKGYSKTKNRKERGKIQTLALISSAPLSTPLTTVEGELLDPGNKVMANSLDRVLRKRNRNREKKSISLAILQSAKLIPSSSPIKPLESGSKTTDVPMQEICKTTKTQLLNNALLLHNMAAWQGKKRNEVSNLLPKVNERDSRNVLPSGCASQPGGYSKGKVADSTTFFNNKVSIPTEVEVLLTQSIETGKKEIQQLCGLPLKKSSYFSNLQDSSVAYFQGKLQTHTLFWVRLGTNENSTETIIESNDNLETPLELRVGADGNLVKVLPTFQNHYSGNATMLDQCQEKSIKYIRTTAGRIVINNALFPSA